MRPTRMLLVAAILTFGPVTAGRAEQSSIQVPQSIRVHNQQIIQRLDRFTRHEGAIAAAATKALAFLKDHYAKEEAYVLPPLGLLPRIAKGEVSRDMEPAIAMADRTRASMSELQNDHTQLTSLMNELIEAGKNAGNEELIRLATRVANQSLNDIEVMQPTTIMIGDYLRQRLTKGQ